MDDLMIREILSKISTKDCLEKCVSAEATNAQRKANELYVKLNDSLNEEQSAMLYEYWLAMRKVVQTTQKEGYDFGLRLSTSLVKEYIREAKRQKKKK